MWGSRGRNSRSAHQILWPLRGKSLRSSALRLDFGAAGNECPHATSDCVLLSWSGPGGIEPAIRGGTHSQTAEGVCDALV